MHVSFYLLDSEAEWWRANRSSEPAASIHWSIGRRAETRAENPGLLDGEATVEWWHLVVEYVAEAAIAYKLKPDAGLGVWLAGVVNDIVRRDEDEWIGPWFRSRGFTPKRGYLETAHVCVAVAAALDLAPDAFTPEDHSTARETLRTRGVSLCTAWLDHDHFHNQRCILGAGLAAASVVGGNPEGVERAVAEFNLCTHLFQADGSYGESSQYAGYAAWGMTMMYETLVRHTPALAERLSPAAYARCVRWWASNLLYVKPLSGWGGAPRPRMVNFNDSGAIAAPHGDVLLHIAARVADSMPDDAALARGLFDQVYLPSLDEGPFDRSSFGMVTRTGFLTPALWAAAHAVVPKSPARLKIPPLQVFSNGDVIARDAWDGATVLATHGGGEPYNVLYHQHADMNSFILAHRNERLLVDPGHSCYRGLVIANDRSTPCHNTCTFTDPSDAGAHNLRNQTSGRVRDVVDGVPSAAVERGGRRLIAERVDEITAIGSECADVYGEPLTRFSRYWIMAGKHAIFVVDHVAAEKPLIVSWHWLLNNRDGRMRLKVVPPDRIVFRRGDVGMKLFHAGSNLNETSLSRMRHAYVHDAYHPKPNQLGEGAPDTGRIITFQQKNAVSESLTIHAIAVDSYGCVAGHHLRRDGEWVGLEAPSRGPGEAGEQYRVRLESSAGALDTSPRSGPTIYIEHVGERRAYRVRASGEPPYRLERA